MAHLHEIKADFEQEKDAKGEFTGRTFFVVKGLASSHGPFPLLGENRVVFASGGKMLKTANGDIEFELYGLVQHVEPESVSGGDSTPAPQLSEGEKKEEEVSA